ncbi:MAG: trehalose-phosphatase [Isosphaera sp.]|nr:trehalose-phosphatase [Isosphaera sp.]
MSEPAALARRAASAPILLVGCDMDGTLAPIVADPALARPDERALRALRRLASMGHTHAAIISGRGLADLTRLVGQVGPLRLLGSHGAESDRPDLSGLDTATRADLGAVRAAALAQIDSPADGAPPAGAVIPANSRPPAQAPGRGAWVEDKPLGFTVHLRGASPQTRARLEAALERATGSVPGVKVRRGIEIIEVAAVRTDKGDALRAVRARVGATAAVFIGDDATDEDAFAALGPGDLGVKVGPGQTSASACLADPRGVAEFLEALAQERAAWLAARGLVPIERHSVLSDQRTLAVMTPDARVVWLCLPRIDSSAIFSALVGGPAGGAFEIRPTGDPGPPTQRYEPDSFVLVTRWPGLSVTDYFDCAGGRAYQRAGRSDLIRVIEGPGEAAIRFAPRLEFGRLRTALRPIEGGLGLEIDGAADPIVLFSPGVRWEILAEGHHHSATARVRPAEAPGGAVTLELRYGTGNPRPHLRPEAERRAATQRFWGGWAGTLRLPRVHGELVRRSALVLKALCHGPTGSIAAAGTTSLPEQLGGVRNWDYRFCWPRDAAMSAAALVRLGNTGMAMKLLDWVLGIVDRCESPDRLCPIYTVTGSHLGTEAELTEVPGYGDSRPVRVGNAAASQVQLDVFGPIADLVARLTEQGAPISPDHWRLVRAMVAAVEARWREPDHGIWEIRGAKRHHVHSKVMCWHTVDRALVVQDAVLGRQSAEWLDLRQRIGRDALAGGWSDRLGAFAIAYGADEPDAATLWVGLSGLLPPTDDRFARTVDAVDRLLRRGPTVYRYTANDDLPGTEGGFSICLSWLIESLVLLGRLDRAAELLDQLAALAGPTGLMSEQFDPAHGIALGNFPQAYSHLGLINAATAVDRALAARGR